jgi:hypothetical protein
MKTKPKRTRLGAIAIVASVAASSLHAQTTGGVVVRVNDPSGAHCIDAETERITVFVRRVFVQRRGGLFTQDNKAGVLVRTQLGADSTDPTSGSSSVTIPSANLVSVKDDANGRVSLALEYAVASDFALAQGKNVTKTMDVFINLAKTRGLSTFGEVLDLAGSALQQVSLPPNPFAQLSSKFLKFANDAVATSIKSGQSDEIAHIGSNFRRGAEPNIARCESAGYERTGVIAAMRSTGAVNQALVPLTNTERDYCFRYSSGSTFELLAARRNGDGSCPAPVNAYAAVMNDYVMLLVSSQPVARPVRAVAPAIVSQFQKESALRCRNLGLPSSACGGESEE